MRFLQQVQIFAIAYAGFAYLGLAQEPSLPQQPETQLASPEVQTEESFGPSDEIDAPAVTPDSHTLAGPMRMGVGSWGPHHSFVVPSFSTVESLDSNPMLTSEHGYRAFTSGMAQAHAIQYFGRDSELRYSGAVRFDTSAEITGMRQVANLQSLGFTHAARFGMWNLLLDDSAQYSQGSSFGDTGLEGMGTVISDLSQWSGNAGLQLQSTVLQSGIQPDQSILSLRAGRISNTSLVEIDRPVGKRGAATAAGYYGLLHFSEPGLLDSTQTGAMAGFERSISARARLGFLGGHTQLHFSGDTNAISTSYGSLMYGRSSPGRLAFEFGAGPEFLTSTASQTRHSDVDWQGLGDITYQMRSIVLQASAMRMITGGSGVLAGARTNLLQGGISRQLSRLYQISGGFGVARNSAMQGPERYQTQYLQTQISRNMMRNASIFFSYNFRNQSASGCGAAGCSITGFQQIFAVGVSWTGRPAGIP